MLVTATGAALPMMPPTMSRLESAFLDFKYSTNAEIFSCMIELSLVLQLVRGPGASPVSSHTVEDLKQKYDPTLSMLVWEKKVGPWLALSEQSSSSAMMMTAR